MDHAERLNALAKELRLTKKQRLYLEILARDPERNQTRAAVAAGYRGAAKVRACNILKTKKAKRFLAELDAVVGVKAAEEAKALAHTRSTIATRQEVLELQTQHLRADVADLIIVHEDGTWSLDLKRAIASGASRLIRELSYDKKGRPRMKVIDTQKTIDQFNRQHEAQTGGADATLGQLVKVMDAATRLTMAKVLLRGEVVEGEARRVE